MLFQLKKRFFFYSLMFKCGSVLASNLIKFIVSQDIFTDSKSTATNSSIQTPYSNNPVSESKLIWFVELLLYRFTLNNMLNGVGIHVLNMPLALAWYALNFWRHMNYDIYIQQSQLANHNHNLQIAITNLKY